MKSRVCYILFAAVVLLSIVGAAAALACTHTESTAAARGKEFDWESIPEKYGFMAEVSVPPNAAVPVTRFGMSRAEAEYAKSYNIRSIYEDAEAVCLVTVLDWLGETGSGSYFTARVERRYKGSIPDLFTLYQCGNSEFSINGAPIYTYGDKLLLFLEPWGGDGYEDSYTSKGVDLFMFYAAAAYDGGIYLLDPDGVFSYNIENECPDITLENCAYDAELVEQLLDYIGLYDKTVSDGLKAYFDAAAHYPDNVPFPPHIYELDVVEKTFESF
ncbi:MAG: hypothetical protein II756_06250 [Clostridia bacterium]|nr:hypothetical protein [Clostridia bacterium]